MSTERFMTIKKKGKFVYHAKAALLIKSPHYASDIKMVFSHAFNE